MIRTQLFTMLFFVICLHEVLAQMSGFEWPDGAEAAVCLTYDDGTDTHLDIAIPDLDDYDLKGTFYLQGDNIRIERIDDWRKAAQNGHELGNHTAYHPCSEELDFITEEFATENYTLKRIFKELQVMNTLLFAIDGETERTFAYTCGDTEYGGISVIDTLSNSRLFVGVRGSGRGVVEDLLGLETFDVPSWGKVEGTAEDHIEIIKEAEETGGLIVFTFHGVGGDYLKISQEVHREILNYLAKNRHKYWVAPFRDVIQYISKKQGI